MLKNKKVITVIILFVGLIFCDVSFAYNFKPITPILGLSQIKVGQTGYFKTVVSGTEIKKFPAKVISVIKTGSKPNYLILIKALGPAIEKVGGIAAGMSGSPFYINGKLVGAIGYSWEMADHRLGLVTPINEMLKIWQYQPLKKKKPKPPKRWSIFTFIKENPLPLLSEYIYDIFCGKKVNACSTSLICGGISKRGAEVIRRSLGLANPIISGIGRGGSYPVIDKNPNIEPGSAVGVALCWGDVTLGAIGTLTAIDKNKRFIAFAHPFLDRGSISYPLVSAYVHSIIPSIKHPFKIGTFMSIIGKTTVDRPEAIGGYISSFPKAISVSFILKDIDNNRVEKRRFQMVCDPFLSYKLLEGTLLGLIDDTWGRRGEGTAFVSVVAEGKGLNRPIKRDNCFFSEKDIAKDCLQEVKDLTAILLLNEFKEIYPLGLDIYVAITSFPHIAYIEKVNLDKDFYSPGDTIKGEFVLKIYRGKQIKKRFKLTLPKNIEEGMYQLYVRGGGIIPENEKQKQPKAYKSLNELLKDFLGQESNNEVIIELRYDVADTDNDTPHQNKKDKTKRQIPYEEVYDQLETKKLKKVYNTKYYIDGFISKNIRIVNSNNKGDKID